MCAAIITTVSHADVLSFCQEPGGILGSIRNEKAAQRTGKNSGERALPGITGMSRTFWLAGVLLVIAGVKGKAQISKPSLLSLHFPPAGREPLPLTCSHCVHATAASGAVSRQLMEPFYLSGTSPVSTCLLPN